MKRYFCDNCNRETDSTKETYEGFEYPKDWVTFKNAIIKNDIPDNKGLEYNGGVELHFCCKNCVIEYFFGKNE